MESKRNIGPRSWMRGIACLFLLGMGLQPVLAQSEWKPLDSGPGRFRVQFPGVPVLREKPTQSLDGPPVWFIHELVTDACHYVVSYGDFPEGSIPAGSPVRALDRVRDGAVKSAGGTLLREKVLTLGPYLGRELELQLPQEGRIRARFFLLDNRVYSISISGREQDMDTPETRGFFKSFRPRPADLMESDPGQARRRLFLFGMGGLGLLLVLFLITLAALQGRKQRR